MLHKDFGGKFSVEKKILCRGESQGACRQDELMGGKSPVIKQFRLRTH
jgi:hypothetical protein